MGENVSRNLFPKLYSKLEKKRQAAMSKPLTMQEITSLMTIRINNEPLFKSIDTFYSDEYKKALEEHKSSKELENIQRFRPAVPSEANLLYNDIHARDEKVEYTGAGAQE